MGSPKKDLEIIYNLQWKNNPGHVNDKANIVAMCDIPATTLNWETFKSYLLKNSGATSDDVKVSYVSIDGKEFPIESQLDFQIALYSFRERARLGGIITLKLDCISDTTRSSSKRLRRMDDKPSVVPDITIINEAEPEWFKKYMTEFKKEIIDEVTESVVNAVSALKLNNCNARKSKFECCKRQRKNSLGHLGEVNEKELIKSLKLERKLDCKLEKLEQKTMKIKEKKLTLMHNNENEKQMDSGFNPEVEDTDRLANVSIIGKHQVAILHMLGGETYMQEWEIINSGTLEWNSSTELRYAWGSETLKPVDKIVACPKLKPQEKGTVSVYLEIPKKAGLYECYWYFHHEDRRFGRWLGCQFSVDPAPTNSLSLNSSDIEKQNEILLPPLNFNTSTPKKIKLEDPSDRKLDNDILMNVNENLQNLKIENQVDSLIGYESDLQSIISVAESASSINSAPSDEFVVLRLPESEDNDKPAESPNVCIPVANIKIEKIDSNEENNKSENEDSNNNTQTTPESSDSVSNEHKSKYAYIVCNGQKIAVPKSLLRADYLATAEDAPESTFNTLKQGISVVHSFELPSSATTSDFESLPKSENISISQNVTSLGNMSSSTCENNKSRLFVFPLNRPGFEVVYPPSQSQSVNESINIHLNESCDSNPNSFIANHSTYLPSLNSLNLDNVSILSTCGGTASECPQCVFSQNLFTQSMSAPNFNHSKCGGQYCQQYLSSSPKSNEGTERFNMQYSSCNNSQRFQPEVNTPIHHNTPLAPHPPHTPTANEAGGLHILPDTLVTGAVNVASSAINTARSVLSMFGMKPEQGKWMNGHWVANDLNCPREIALRRLYEMGFWDRDLNATLLARYNDDITKVISELLQ